MENKKQKITQLCVSPDTTIIAALKQMDLLGRKLLIVLSDNKFISILSVGDIQRAILRQENLESPIRNILRYEIKVARDTDDLEKIHATMLEYRIECMPIIDNDNKLVDVLFWEDEFTVKIKQSDALKNVPVVVMAGGFGNRLKPLTNIIPKPLVPIGEKPIIQMIVEDFNDLGVDEFYFSVNYKAEMIQYYFDHLENKKYSIEYFKEPFPLGTAGSLHLLKDKIKSTFFVSNCDIIIREDYSEIYKFHKNQKNDITLVGSLKHLKIPYGILETGEGGALKSMKEKPEFTYIINSGMYVLEPEMLKRIPENKFFHITELIENVKNEGGRVGVFPVSEKSWFDIGEWAEYQETLKYFEKEK